jgi:hypothetical protein
MKKARGDGLHRETGITQTVMAGLGPAIHVLSFSA